MNQTLKTAILNGRKIRFDKMETKSGILYADSFKVGSPIFTDALMTQKADGIFAVSSRLFTVEAGVIMNISESHPRLHKLTGRRNHILALSSREI